MRLMQHQQRGVTIAHEHPRYYFAHEPGCGKTIMSLAIVSDAKAQGFKGKTLVLAPLSILHCAWAQDAEHFPELKTIVVYSKNKNERLQQLRSGADVLVTNYETFKKLTDEFWAAGVRRLIVDEASKAKNHDTQITRAIHRFSARCTSVYMLSGTPCANGAHEWIPQLMALKPTLFGGSYWQTMYRYFYPVKRVIGDKERIIGWRQVGGDDSAQPAGSAWQLIGSVPSEKVHPIKAEFLAKLRSCSWSLSKKECLDLPESRDVVREVALGDAERRAYDGMLESLRLELSDGQTINAAMQARAMKLRQITGGAILHDDTVTKLGNSKMDELLAVLEEIGDRPCVIWAEFTNEINRIAAAVGPNCQIINGQTPPQARTDAVHQFQMGKLRRLVCHPAAAGHGITLTAASHAIYFSHGYSFETYQQSRDRIHRAGQHDPCTYWHLTATKTIDERILACLRHKKDAHQAIFDELGAEAMVV